MGTLVKVRLYSAVNEFKRSDAEAIKDWAVKDNITRSTFNECFLQ